MGFGGFGLDPEYCGLGLGSGGQVLALTLADAVHEEQHLTIRFNYDCPSLTSSLCE